MDEPTAADKDALAALDEWLTARDRYFGVVDDPDSGDALEAAEDKLEALARARRLT